MTLGNLLSILRLLPWVATGLITYPLVLIRRCTAQRVPARFVIFPQSKIGDFVAQTPVFSAIRESCPQASIAVVLTNPALAGLVRCHPSVNEIYVFDTGGGRLKKFELIWWLLNRRFDFALNLSCQSWLDFIALYGLIPLRVSVGAPGPDLTCTILARLLSTEIANYPRGSYSSAFYVGLLRFAGIHNTSCSRKLFPCPADRAHVEPLLSAGEHAGQGPKIGLSCSCGNRLKEWPGEYFAALADALVAQRGAQVFLLGSSGDTDIVRGIRSHMKQHAADLSGKLTLGQLAALCEHLDLFIAVDSGPLYIACAVGTPVINIAGPVDVLEQFLPSDKAQYLRLDLPCSPCSFISPHATVCRRGTRECVTRIMPEDVMARAAGILDHE